MNKSATVCLLLAMVVLLVSYASAEHKRPDNKPSRIDDVNSEVVKPLDNILGDLDGLRIRRHAQGGDNQGGQGGQGGGRRPPSNNNHGQRNGQNGQGDQNSNEN
ncbi:uncharacterized protein LOC128722215 [Anopheles nili]|uniref:uncharacterized protein LOC128722215 n=1 Tax=Anopheles nili TaxID=185578 RepID=UPI00237B4682|nr:uncharacterized protein LOC128722215 [Anopheles nili]